MGTTKQELVDIGERASWTAAQAFLAVFTVGDVDTARSAAIAAVAAILSVLKGWVGTKVDPSTGAAVRLPQAP